VLADAIGGPCIRRQSGRIDCESRRALGDCCAVAGRDPKRLDGCRPGDRRGEPISTRGAVLFGRCPRLGVLCDERTATRALIDGGFVMRRGAGRPLFRPMIRTARRPSLDRPTVMHRPPNGGHAGQKDLRPASMIRFPRADRQDDIVEPLWVRPATAQQSAQSATRLAIDLPDLSTDCRDRRFASRETFPSMSSSRPLLLVPPAVDQKKSSSFFRRDLGQNYDRPAVGVRDLCAACADHCATPAQQGRSDIRKQRCFAASSARSRRGDFTSPRSVRCECSRPPPARCAGAVDRARMWRRDRAYHGWREQERCLRTLISS